MPGYFQRRASVTSTLQARSRPTGELFTNPPAYYSIISGPKHPADKVCQGSAGSQLFYFVRTTVLPQFYFVRTTVLPLFYFVRTSERVVQSDVERGLRSCDSLAKHSLAISRLYPERADCECVPYDS